MNLHQKKLGLFGQLENLVKYKEWLIFNGPGNIHSPYFRSEECRDKQSTKVVGFNGHPTIYIHWEDRFNYDAYHRDIGNLDKAISATKQAIQEQADEFYRNANDCDHSNLILRREVAKQKYAYQNAVSKYSEICQRNADLSVALNEQMQVLAVSQQEKSSVKSKLNDIKQKIHSSYAEELDMHGSQPEAIIAKKLSIEERKVYDQLVLLNDSDRAKILFDIFNSEDRQFIKSLIISIGFDAALIAHIAATYDNSEIFDYALDKGANLDRLFIDGITALELILQSSKQDYINKTLSSVEVPLCSVINMADRGDVDSLALLHTKDPNIFTKHDGVIGYCLVHLLALGDHLEALNLALALDSKCVDATTLSGENLFQIVVRSCSLDAFSAISDHISAVDEISKLITSDNDSLVIKAMEYCILDLEARSEILASMLFAFKAELAYRIFNDPDELKAIFEYFLMDNEFDHAKEIYKAYTNILNQEYVDSLKTNESSLSVIECLETIDTDIFEITEEDSVLVGEISNITFSEFGF